MIMFALLSVMLTIAFYTDMRSMTIPNWLSMGAAAAGLCGQSFLNGWNGLIASAFGLLAGFGVVLVLHLAGAVGAGDVKLFAAIGALSDVSFVISTLTYSVFFAALIGIAILSVRRKRGREALTSVWAALWTLLLFRNTAAFRSWRSGDAIRFPFMAAVLPAALTAYAFG